MENNEIVPVKETLQDVEEAIETLSYYLKAVSKDNEELVKNYKESTRRLCESLGFRDYLVDRYRDKRSTENVKISKQISM